MKVLISGAAGFIGSHLADRLINTSHELAVIDDLSNGLEKNINPAVARHWGCGVESQHAALRIKEFKPDVVFHLAALGSVPFSVKHPGKVFEANVHGTANMLKAATDAGVRRFVFASSASYYGDALVSPEYGPVAKTEDMPPRPLNHYGASKVCGEHWGNAFYRMHGLCFTALRFFNVFGPRQRDDTELAAVVPKFIKAAIAGDRIELHNEGRQTRDLTYIDNVIGALLAVVEAPDERVAGQSFNVCCGEGVKILDLADEIVKEVWKYTGRTATQLHLTDARPGDIRDSFGSYDKLKRATGWEPMVSWQEGIKRTVEAKRG